MKHVLGASLAAIISLGFAGAHAAQTVLTFDTDPQLHGELVDVSSLDFVESVIVDNRDNNGNAPDALVYFDTSLTGTRDSDLEDPFTDIDTLLPVSPGGIAIIPDQADPLADDEARGGYVTFVFDVPVMMDSIRFFDASTATVTLYRDKAATDVIDVFTISGLDDVLDSPSGNKSGILSLVAGEAALSLKIDLKNTSGGFDNVTFEAVPVPGALPLMVGGVALVAAAGRRRRQR